MWGLTPCGGSRRPHTPAEAQGASPHTFWKERVLRRGEKSPDGETRAGGVLRIFRQLRKCARGNSPERATDYRRGQATRSPRSRDLQQTTPPWGGAGVGQFIIHHSSFIIRNWQSPCGSAAALPVWFYRKDAKGGTAHSVRDRLTAPLAKRMRTANIQLGTARERSDRTRNGQLRLCRSTRRTSTAPPIN